MTEAGSVTDQQLLSGLADQLNKGDLLLTQQHFVDALTVVQQQLTGMEANEPRREHFAQQARGKWSHGDHDGDFGRSRWGWDQC